MSALNKSDKYDELYKKYKRLIDRADNDTVDGYYYIDKHHRVKAKLDVLTGILMIGETSQKWSKGAVI